jgi:tetratricopeptide (TPR) repeat protein
VGYANVASKLCKLGDCAAGVEAQRKTLALLKKAHSKPHPNVAMALSNLAGMLLREKNVAEAVPLFDEALTMQVTLLGEQHPDAIYSRATFARALVENQQFDAALTEGSKAYALSGSLSPDSASVVDVAQIYGDVLCRAKRYADAIPVLNGALASLKKQTPSDEREIASTESLLGLATAGNGQHAVGRAMSERAAAKLLALTSDKHLSYLDAQKRLQLIDAMPK